MRKTSGREETKTKKNRDGRRPTPWKGSWLPFSAVSAVLNPKGGNALDISARARRIDNQMPSVMWRFSDSFKIEICAERWQDPSPTSTTTGIEPRNCVLLSLLARIDPFSITRRTLSLLLPFFSLFSPFSSLEKRSHHQGYGRQPFYMTTTTTLGGWKWVGGNFWLLAFLLLL